ncbi:Glyoxalase/Bleomycin resistance protein/Dioxygenase superfamily protein [Hartmannibacter diazotrophicus]|uniref:Glyoxalase/Bleomycin resistance protein/Dioxygenase superfamily protein n=1 Tax=Hartmannibacter diazotrophicus TaxID=1482074 RepID=A0A2C9D770_9HYPH|nr:VOC family protein [Hartmannibacter diazotrophicus]SON56174.1 Glyoxalase/Bleomycin resistance protein/Dioxygenase superfamily protein [Hartmannibacter diazotrophicus]
MRWRGVHHVEFSVLDYEASVAFYDRMFGWLGYKSFWTLDIGYHSTYYMARFPVPHSYIGIQPAKSGEKLRHEDRSVGIHHIALWARSRREVDDFYSDFLLKNGLDVTDPPREYAVYAPGYYAVFFDDPINGIHWELAHTPRLPSPFALRRWMKAMKEATAGHPEWNGSPAAAAMRQLPKR